MSTTTLTLTLDMPDVGEESSWGSFEALLLAMGKELPAQALAAALADVQEELIDRVLRSPLAAGARPAGAVRLPGLWRHQRLRPQGAAQPATQAGDIGGHRRADLVACGLPVV